MWNANYTQGNDLILKATGVSWNEIVKANSSRQFGYCANKEEEEVPNTDAEDIEKDKALLVFDTIKNNNSSEHSITTQLNLITQGSNNSNISWSSSNGSIISVSGAVTRPDANSNDEVITLTALFTKGGESDSKTFSLTVLKEEEVVNDDLIAVTTDRDLLTFDAIRNLNISESNITTQLNLMTKGTNDSDIAWSSSDTSIISNTGTVVRAESTASDESVTLTAVLSKGAEQELVTFILLVTKKEAEVVVNTDAEDLAADKALLIFDAIRASNSSESDITTALSLLTVGSNGSSIAWRSSDSTIISTAGVVTRGATNQSVTLTATLTKGVETDSKTFTLLVLKEIDENSACQVDYTVGNEWSTGAGVSLTVTNQLGALSSWEITWTFPSGQTIKSLWNGNETQTEAYVSVLNEGYNGNVADEGDIKFGFNLDHSGTNDVPIDIRLNGNLCDGQIGGVEKPSKPTNLVADLVDNVIVNLTWTDNSENEDNFLVLMMELGV